MSKYAIQWIGSEMSFCDEETQKRYANFCHIITEEKLDELKEFIRNNRIDFKEFCGPNNRCNPLKLALEKGRTDCALLIYNNLNYDSQFFFDHSLEHVNYKNNTHREAVMDFREKQKLKKARSTEIWSCVAASGIDLSSGRDHFLRDYFSQYGVIDSIHQFFSQEMLGSLDDLRLDTDLLDLEEKKLVKEKLFDLFMEKTKKPASVTRPYDYHGAELVARLR